jgi:hypothetical protein
MAQSWTGDLVANYEIAVLSSSGQTFFPVWHRLQPWTPWSLSYDAPVADLESFVGEKEHRSRVVGITTQRRAAQIVVS